MKKTLFLCIPFAICLAFTGCSNSEKNQEQATSSQVETTTTDTEASTSTESAQADVDKSIEANITAIAPNAVLAVNDNNSLSVDLTDQYDESDKGYIGNFMYDCTRIIATSNFSEKYAGISLSYVSKKVFPVITVTDYKNAADYSTNLFCPGEDSNYVAAVKIMYDKLFYNRDINNKSGTEQKSEDDLWFYSSFPNSLPHKLSDSTYVVNYRYDTEDTYSYGKSVGNDIEIAVENLRQYLNSNSNMLTFDSFLIVCFDGDSDTRYCEYELAKKEDGSWGVTTYNLNDDNFKKGLEEMIN